MKTLLFERFTLVSRHSTEELTTWTNASLGHFYINPLITPGGPFYGKSDKNGFEMMATVTLKNQMAPKVTGRYEAHHSGTRIYVRQSLRPLMWLNILMSYAAITLFLFWPIVEKIQNNHLGDFALLTKVLPFGYVALLLALMLIYWPAAKKTKGRLTDIFEAHDADCIEETFRP